MLFCQTDSKMCDYFNVDSLLWCTSVSAARPLLGSSHSDPSEAKLLPQSQRGKAVAWHAYSAWPPSTHRLLHPLSLSSFRIYQILISHSLWLTVHSPSYQSEITFCLCLMCVFLGFFSFVSDRLFSLLACVKTRCIHSEGHSLMDGSAFAQSRAMKITR